LGKYLLIESRDPYEYADTNYFYDLARDLAERGNDVAFYLMQNGVLVARSGAKPDKVGELRQGAPRVRVLADEFSLRERGISKDATAPGIEVTEIGTLVDLLVEDGRKAIWH
jgi:sulfur relay (sulfurtransferase) complex TusBCD TusD component (DsrE family)